MSSRQLEEAQERNVDEKIAEYIGLTYEEYVSLQPEIQSIDGDDGELYGHMVEFHASVPPALAAKLGSGRLELPPGFLEAEEDNYQPDDL